MNPPTGSSSEATLIVLTHDDAAYIQDCLRSIDETWIAQSQPVVVLDNGSTDETLSILTQWQANLGGAQQVHINPLGSNIGPLAGLLQLLRSVQTPWACVLHGDDVLGEGYGHLVRRAIADLRTDQVLLPTLQPFGKSSGEMRPQKPPVLRSRRACRTILSVYGAYPIGGAVIPVRRAITVLEQHEFVFACAEDWLLMHGLVSGGCHLRRLPGATYGYRVHSGSASFTDLQSYSVGYVRGTLARAPRSLRSRIAAAQTGREFRTALSPSRYLDGLRDGLGAECARIQRLATQADWQAIPGLGLARALKWLSSRSGSIAS